MEHTGRLELTWVDKYQEKVIEPRILVEDKEKSYGDPHSENMLIHGDNLIALQALQQDYAGKIKCIYIDPPFNTGQAFDNYDDGLEHSIWLSLIRNRVLLLHSLLSDGGTLFVHIDDNEMPYLIVLLDEIFGRNNRISIVTFKQASATGHKAINPGIVSVTNFVIIYAKDKTQWRPKVIEIHSNMKGEESEDNVRRLLSIEKPDNTAEIVLHVYKLKEGWDVNNLFTIIPLNAAKSDILAMQTIGRGLRLPFGEITGNEEIDTLDIVAHDHYRELVDEIKSSDIFRYRDLDKTDVEPTDTVDVSSPVDDGQLSLFDLAVTDTGVKSFAEINNPQTQQELYAAYIKAFGPTKPKQKESEGDQLSIDMFLTPGGESTGTSATPQVTSTAAGKQQPMTKDEFVQKIKEYSGKAISVPKILVQTTSTVTFNRFAVKRTIADFEVAVARIERFDAINQQVLTSVDAQILEVDDALNTLACMLLDSISELSYDDADFIIDIVEQYLSQIEGEEEDKRRIVRRYATLIINDIRSQIYQHMDRKTWDIHIVQKDLILFKKFVKNVKKDGRVRFDRPFTDKANIKKYLFTGYTKGYYTENAFDSDPERLFSIILEEDPAVIRWIKPPLNQLGLFWQAGQQYNPDFLVETADAKYMVEVKAANEVTNDEVVAKAREGIKWCRFASTADPDHKPWQYRLVIDANIKPGNSCKYTLGTACEISEE